MAGFGLELYDRLTPDLIARWAGSRIHSPGWLEGYSLNNPRDVNETVAMVQNGLWMPRISHIAGQMVDEHHLEAFPLFRNYLEGWAFVGGYVFPDFRYQRHHGLLADAWHLFRVWAKKIGFRELHCVAFQENTPADVWIRECCKFTKVACLHEAVQDHTEAWRNILLYTQNDTPEERENAATRARLAFPHAR